MSYDVQPSISKHITVRTMRVFGSHMAFAGSVAAPAVQRRPGASLANPNKAARRVTAVEFASDDEDT